MWLRALTLAACGLLLASGSAGAAVLVGRGDLFVGQIHRSRWHLDGARLTVRLADDTPAHAVPVIVACGDDASGGSGNPIWARSVQRHVWLSAKQSVLRLTFAHDISRWTNFCFVEDGESYGGATAVMRLASGTRPGCVADGRERVLASNPQALLTDVWDPNYGPLGVDGGVAERACLRPNGRPVFIAAYGGMDGVPTRGTNLVSGPFALAGTRLAWANNAYGRNGEAAASPLTILDLRTPDRPHMVGPSIPSAPPSYDARSEVVEVALSSAGSVAWTLHAGGPLSTPASPDTSQLLLHTARGAEMLLAQSDSATHFAPRFSEDGNTISWVVNHQTQSAAVGP